MELWAKLAVVYTAAPLLALAIRGFDDRMEQAVEDAKRLIPIPLARSSSERLEHDVASTLSIGAAMLAVGIGFENSVVLHVALALGLLTLGLPLLHEVVPAIVSGARWGAEWGRRSEKEYRERRNSVFPFDYGAPDVQRGEGNVDAEIGVDDG